MTENTSFQTCSNHPDRPARWLCAECGRAFCEECITPVCDKYFCRECLKQMDVEMPASGAEPPEWPDLHWDANLVKRMLAFGYDFVLCIAVLHGLKSRLSVSCLLLSER